MTELERRMVYSADWWLFTLYVIGMGYLAFNIELFSVVTFATGMLAVMILQERAQVFWGKRDISAYNSVIVISNILVCLGIIFCTVAAIFQLTNELAAAQKMLAIGIVFSVLGMIYIRVGVALRLIHIRRKIDYIFCTGTHYPDKGSMTLNSQFPRGKRLFFVFKQKAGSRYWAIVESVYPDEKNSQQYVILLESAKAGFRNRYVPVAWKLHTGGSGVSTLRPYVQHTTVEDCIYTLPEYLLSPNDLEYIGSAY